MKSVLTSKHWKLLGVTFLIVLAVIVFLDFRLRGPEAEAVKEILQTEFNSVPPPSQATVLRSHSVSKPGTAIVGAEYSASMGYEALSQYYDSELSKQDWKYVGEDRLKGGAFGLRVAHTTARGNMRLA